MHWLQKKKTEKAARGAPSPEDSTALGRQARPAVPRKVGCSEPASPQALPCLKVLLEVTALQDLGAVLRERAGHHQLVEKLVDQDAGLLAMLQHHRLTIHRAEVLLHQEVGEAERAIGVSTGGVQRVQQSLQADVAHEVIVHIFRVGVEVVFLGGVGLAANHTQGFGAGIRGTGRVRLAHGQLGRWNGRKPTQDDSVSSGDNQDLPGAMHRPKREQDSRCLFS